MKIDRSKPARLSRRLLGALGALPLLLLPDPASGQIDVITVDCTPFLSPGPSSFGPTHTMGMALQAVDQGGDFNVTEVTPQAFRAMSATQLATFDLIAVNNHPFRISDGCIWTAPGSSPGLGTTWHDVVGVEAGGRVVLTSHDAPRFKLLRTPPAGPLFTGFEPFGTVGLVRQAALWAGGVPGATGLLIFNDAARFISGPGVPILGIGWDNPELNLPLAWGIVDLDQAGGNFMNGGYTDILPAFAAHPIYDGTAVGGVVLSDVRGAENTLSSFSANIGDTSFHSVFDAFNALIFTPTEVVVNAGIVDVDGLCVCTGFAAPGPDGKAITLVRPEPQAEIDIKPGSFPNAVNPGAKGVIPVAVLTTDTFDALDVDPLSVMFGPAGAGIAHAAGHAEDVDADGDLDLVLHFRTRETGIACGDTEATLTGQTFGGLPFTGSDSLKTSGCK